MRPPCRFVPTAWQALFDQAKIGPGQRVLIHAAAGGVGTFAVQLAKWKGAHVIGTASARNHDFLRDLGADELIDYTTTRFEDVVHTLTWCSTPSPARSKNAPGRRSSRAACWCRSWGSPRPNAQQHGVRGMMVFVRPNAEQLTRIAELIDAQAQSDRRNGPAAGRARRREQSTGHVRGKIVLRVV